MKSKLFKTIPCLLLTLLLACPAALAADAPADYNALLGKALTALDELTAARGQLTVTGNATLVAAPDRASVTLGVQLQGPVLEDVQASVNTAMAAVIVALENSGIARDLITTNDYSVSPVYDYSGDTPKATGYQVSNNVAVRVQDFNRIGAVIDAATAAGANQVYGISFDTSSRQKLYNDALWNAIADARAKALVMAEATGRQLGDLRTVEERAGMDVTPRAYSAMAMDAVAGTQILGGSLQITAQVVAVFDLK
ncbi:MAG: SIMPL domain-containing protein [Oscillospiraceae bacterium]|jgi:uncharacterized protein YggE|nr:SIMPL domain-containing protein [Oscillospiraceae bacterium]